MRARSIITDLAPDAAGKRTPALITPALALFPLGLALFHSSYEMSVGPVALNFEVLAILFAWFAALLRSPALNPLIGFLAYFLILSVGVATNAVRAGEISGPLYFFQGMLFLSVALLPAALGLTRRECRLTAAVFLALFLRPPNSLSTLKGRRCAVRRS